MAILMGVPTGALASESPKPHDPLNAPTFQQQSTNWTSAQFQAYNAKLQEVQDLANGTASLGTQPNCIGCIPSSYYANMNVVYEGKADCMCGPATATEMFSTLTQYYNSPPYPYLTLSQVEAQMKITCSIGTYRYQLQNEMNNGSQHVNTYVWGDVANASAVHYDTSVDVGLGQYPVGYDGETYSSRNGYPLDNYQGVNWDHYFPAYGYSPGYLYVADPHYAYDHHYTDEAVYLFIDNFPYANQVLW